MALALTLSQDEIALISSAISEIESIRFCEDVDVVIVATSGVCGRFTLSIVHCAFRLLRVKVSANDELDPLIAGDFEQFVSSEFNQIVAHAQPSDGASLVVVIIELFQQISSFDPATSNPLRAKPQNEASPSAAISSGRHHGDEEEEADEDDAAEWNAESFFAKQAELKRERQLLMIARSGNNNNNGGEDANYVVVLAMHHIYCQYKRRYIIELARDLDLRGCYLFGKPGRVIVEGCREAVDLYSRSIRAIRTWKLCKENALLRSDELCNRSDGAVFEPSFGFVAVTCEGEIKDICAARNADKLFQCCFHFSYGVSNAHDSSKQD